ncbi:MAG: hypothetical protein WD294_10745 [Phycisphaeraceae bacterium]
MSENISDSNGIFNVLIIVAFVALLVGVIVMWSTNASLFGPALEDLAGGMKNPFGIVD